MATDADRDSAEAEANANAAAWLEMAESAQYVELHRPPYKTVLDGRFSLAQLEAIVARLKALEKDTADHGKGNRRRARRPKAGYAGSRDSAPPRGTAKDMGSHASNPPGYLDCRNWPIGEK